MFIRGRAASLGAPFAGLGAFFDEDLPMHPATASPRISRIAALLRPWLSLCTPLTLALPFLLSAGIAPLHAQADPFVPPVGTALIPRGDLVAWDRYPGVFTFAPGDVVTTVTDTIKYIVLDTRTIPSLVLGDTYYVRLKEFHERADDPCASHECWVYQGRRQSDSWPNLVPADVTKYLNVYGDALREVSKPTVAHPLDFTSDSAISPQ